MNPCDQGPYRTDPLKKRTIDPSSAQELFKRLFPELQFNVTVEKSETGLTIKLRRYHEKGTMTIRYECEHPFEYESPNQFVKRMHEEVYAIWGVNVPPERTWYPKPGAKCT